MGSVGVAAWIAGIAFPTLLLIGWLTGELGPKAAAAFAILGAAAWIGLPRIPNGAMLVTPALAVMDIVLVLVVFKRDIRIG
ncbi:MAG TPA: hypothetical protein VFO58_01035 [Vicinamibacterales bacterium]|nr:hypothetical protein [Vicinamibacterales bacterium]